MKFKLKSKYSPSPDQQKAIDEIAQSINRNVTRRNLMKMILEE